MTRAVLGLSVLSVLACGAAVDRRDPLEPGREPRLGLPIMSLVWKRVVHDRSKDHLPQEFAGPVVSRRIDGDTLYVGSHAGELWALDGKGRVLWRQRVGATSARPLVASGRVYLGTDDGSMLAIDTVDGEIIWRATTKGAVLKPPVIVDDLVIFSNDADHVYAVERQSGDWRWQYERDTPEEFTIRGHAGVAALTRDGGSRVFTGFADGHVVALGAETGEVVWIRSLQGANAQFVDVDTTPVVHEGSLYVASSSGGLFALDVADGSERWRFEVHGTREATIDDGRLFVAAADAGLFALDLGGRVRWHQGMRGAGDPSRPIVLGRVLFVSTSETGLFAVDKGSGELLQMFDPGPGISSEPAIIDDRLFVLSNGGVLYAMALSLP